MMADAGGSDRRLRLRAVLARSFAILVAVTLLTAGVGAAVTYDVYGTEPATRLESQTVSSWAAVGSFDHAATVTNGTEAFPEGTVLANRSLYFTRVSPELTGVFEYDYDTTETPPVTRRSRSRWSTDPSRAPPRTRPSTGVSRTRSVTL